VASINVNSSRTIAYSVLQWYSVKKKSKSFPCLLKSKSCFDEAGAAKNAHKRLARSTLYFIIVPLIYSAMHCSNFLVIVPQRRRKKEISIWS
jgi:hypothetical protein